MSRNVPTPKVAAHWSFAIFACTLIAYLQTNLGYRQPFFTFYLVHSTFAVIFPFHLLYLTATTKYSAPALCNGLVIALTNHLAPSTPSKFPRYQFLRLILALTVGLTYPGLLWFSIWNTNAFFAYLMTSFRYKWEPRKFGAVLLATIGCPHCCAPSIERVSLKPSAPLVGDLLTLVASIGYALYQVLYKKYAALPSDPELVAESCLRTPPASDDPPDIEYETVAFDTQDAVYPPPFGLHPNLLTSAIGLCTLGLLWIFIPVLHYLGFESCFLGVWGPIIVSVGNLLTIVLVFISDIIFGAGVEAVTLGGVVGCGLIVAAFGVLVHDLLDKRRHATETN
ncbi:hypothetical protein DFH09DRAFT_1123342 [Mycena vulgaris]|nr:hypothetical protein DFH09DRAFT_1123342 [Mycena vulgaris]